MKHALLIISMLVIATASSQTLILTEARHTPGHRELLLRGGFIDADSAFLQVFNADGDELYAEPQYRTFKLSLGTYRQYDLKFTDAQGREKRITFRELSDDQTEDFPWIDVDFGCQGNVTYIKHRNRKLDWWEYDTGMGY